MNRKKRASINGSITDLFAVDGSFIALPVKLTDFTVRLTAGDALLQWNSEGESNVKSYTIQRAYDAQSFENIGIVPASVYNFEKQTYSFTDAGIVNSGKITVYYRLIEISNDEKSEYSKVIKVNLAGNNPWDVKLLSNPVPDNMAVMLSGVSGNIKLSIFSFSGKLVYTKSLQNINGQFNIPVILQKGIFVLAAENNNELKSVKFIKL